MAPNQSDFCLPMTNLALRFFKRRSTLEYRRYRKKLSFLDS